MNELAEKFRSRPILYTATFFAGISCLFFLPVVLQGKLLAPGDALIQYLPAFQGGTHLWTTQILCGFPWYADPQTQTFYPLKQILSLLPYGWNIYMMCAYTLAGFFSALYAYSLTRSWTAALVAGCIYAFNGFLLSNLRHTTMVHSAVWLPLALLSIRQARIDRSESKNKDAWWFSCTVIATALLCLGGHPQMFSYGVALLGFYVIAETLEAEKFARLRFALLSYFALILGVGISAIVILPAAELASFSWRWAMTYKMFVEYGLLPVNLVSQVFPFIFGCFKDSLYGCNYFGAYDLQCVSGYCGLFTFLLFPIGAITFRKEKVVIFWIIALFLLFILLFGDVGLLSHAAYQLPCYNRFRVPTRHFLEISMALSSLTAFGIAALARNTISKKMAMRAHAIFVCFFGVVGCIAYIFAGFSQERVQATQAGTFGLYPWTNPALGIPIFLFLIGSAIYIICLRRPQMRWHLLILLFVLDFASVAAGSEYASLSPPASALNSPADAAWLNAESSKTHQRVLSLRGNSGKADELPVNLSMLWGVENACGYENLLPLRISKLLNMKEGGFLVGPWAAQDDHSLDILAVRYILLPKNDSRYPAPSGSRWRFVKEAGDALIYENRRAMPRVWLTQDLRTLAIDIEPDVIASAVQNGKLAERPIDFKSTVLIEGQLGRSFSLPAGSHNQNAFLEITDLNDTTMTIKTKTVASAILVTSDSFYPGWNAFVDDEPVHVYQADYVIRAIILPAGEHTVKFIFSPILLKLGLAICISSLVATIVTAYLLSRRSR